MVLSLNNIYHGNLSIYATATTTLATITTTGDTYNDEYAIARITTTNRIVSNAVFAPLQTWRLVVTTPYQWPWPLLRFGALPPKVYLSKASSLLNLVIFPSGIPIDEDVG